MQVISVVATPFAVCGFSGQWFRRWKGWHVYIFRLRPCGQRCVGVCVGVCACFVAFLVVHGALHEGKLMAPSGKTHSSLF